MPTTTIHGLPYPALTDAPDGPAAFEALADAVDGLLTAADVTTYTPVLSGGGVSPGSGGTTTGWSLRLGPLVYVFAHITAGAGGASGGGAALSVSLPVAPLEQGFVSALYRAAGSTNYREGLAVLAAGSTAAGLWIDYGGTGELETATSARGVPFQTAGTIASISGIYRVE